ncbi:DUF1707 domain-containing protein [Planotetraspora kaengkrachanensis]|uniref:Cell wall-active antibiotics response LiaF-like C-terminal domain-containing protein n=1 Tax=Planotetraspora kaengkrachanensis TaxID=575193 RepID=A0A8J3LT95_9ACTN|nr:DUF1707 domain-containing protein [Planotetraspora kaengkrachanensis]GIG77767.1 hypothetical protein Pka01_08940 [Planotetraspora kaengkrachanensis]
MTTDLPERAGEVVNLTSGTGKIVRTGRWRGPRVLRIKSVYGGPRLDLSEAVIEYPEITLDLNLMYGSARIILPQGASADADGVNCEWGRVLSKVPGAPRPGQLHVRVTGKLGYGKVRIRYGSARKRRWFTR